MVTSLSVLLYFAQFAEEREKRQYPEEDRQVVDYDLGELKDILKDRFPPEQGRLHLCIYDFKTKTSTQIEGHREVYPASMIKTLLLIAALDEVQKGHLSLDETLVLSERDKYVGNTRVGGTGVLQFAEEGNLYALDELLRLMVSKSDNVAANMVLETVGRDTINNLCHRLELESTAVNRRMFEVVSDRPSNVSTACDLNRMLVALESGEVLGRPYLDQVRNMMYEADKSRIGRYIRPEVEVANKTGTTGSILGDMGLLYFDDRPPVAMTVVVEDYRDQEETAKELARLIDDVVSFMRREEYADKDER